MAYNPDIHHRRSIRLKDYDYASPGAYFITTFTQNREPLLGQLSAGAMKLNSAGLMLQSVWETLPVRFPQITLDEFVVMPEHVHGIIFIDHDAETRPVKRGDHKDTPTATSVRTQPSVLPPFSSATPNIQSSETCQQTTPRGTLAGTLGRIIQAFKSLTTHEYTIGVNQHGWPTFPGKLWHRDYYEHIIRTEENLDKIRQYIRNNPRRRAFP